MGFISSGTFLLSGKNGKVAGFGRCAELTWKESELHYWPWKFWQHSTLIFCFIMSNLRICHWRTQLPTHFSTLHWTWEPWPQLWLWQTQKYRTSNTQERCRWWELTAPRLPPACLPKVGKLSLLQRTQVLGVRMTKCLSGSILFQEERKEYKKTNKRWNIPNIQNYSAI